MGGIKLFSRFFSIKKEQDSEFFENNAITAAYLVGAYASAIVESSWDGVFKEVDGKFQQISYVKENETFKKWLSNRQIRYSNLLRIANKANYFQRKFNLNSPIIQDLATLVTDTLKLKPSGFVSDDEVSFAFLRGYNDYRKFKYTKKGEKTNANS